MQLFYYNQCYLLRYGVEILANKGILLAMDTDKLDLYLFMRDYGEDWSN